MGQISLSIPQIGLADTTEDVKIQNAFTTIQNVINGGLDTNNLSASAGITLGQLAAGAAGLRVLDKSAAYTAANGDLVVVTGGAPLTITAPAPVANGRFGVYAQFSMSGSSPVTLQAASGTPFYLLGSGGVGVSSVLLGSQGAYVVFVSEGINWYAINGQQDTGWVALGYATGWSTTAACFAAAVRVIGDRAYLRGTCTNNSGTNNGAPFAAALPAAARPASTVTFSAAPGNSATVTNAGVFACGNFVSIGATLGLDGVTYSLS